MFYVALLAVPFFSGVLLWDFLGLPWELKRWLLLWHAPVSLTVLSFYLLPYAISHIRRYAPWLKGRGSIKGYSGVSVSVLLIASVSSGFWLMFIGATGNNAGEIAAFLHLWGSFALFLSLIVHVYSGLPVSKGAFALLPVFLVFYPPSVSAESKEQKEAAARGKTLFFSTKESGIKGLSMGDGSKSCGSCHKGGFNETNRLLFESNRQDPAKNGVIGHKGIKNFFANDFVQDYIAAIIEQGGKVENPKSPSKEIARAMGELHLFIRSKENLPFFSTWVRLDENITHYNRSEWQNSANCKKCHPEIFRQWANSNHRLMGGSNPYYMVLEELAAKEEGEGFRFWCMGCHSPTQLTSGARKTDGKNRMLDRDGKSLLEDMKHIDKTAEEGTSCLFCHRIERLEEVPGNGGYMINLRGREKYIFEEADGVALYIHEASVNAKPKTHAKSYSKDFYKDSKYCMSCHTEFSPGKGAVIVDTYGEWKNSPYNKGAKNPKTKECIDCHMHATPSEPDKKTAGRSTVGGKLKENVRTHHFAGSNHFLSGLRSKEHEKMTVEMLKAAVKIEPIRSGNGVAVKVSNIGAGHHLPTGVSDFRELWLEISVKDGNGKEILSSGKLDEKGEITKGSRIFRKVFGDKDGKPVGLAFWKYEKLLEDTRIEAGGYRVENYPLQTLPSYPIKVSVKLNFRIYPQWVTNIVQKSYPALPSPSVVTLHAVERVWSKP